MQANNRRRTGAHSTRRRFLKQAGLAATGALATCWGARRPLYGAARQVVSGRSDMKARLRPDLLDENSPEGIEVVQLTTEADVWGFFASSLYRSCAPHRRP